MKLIQIKLNNIKIFKGYNEFKFSEDDDLITISGKNGSGKSTLLKSIIIAQKAFFYKYIIQSNTLSEKDKNSINLSILDFLESSESNISLIFKMNSRKAEYRVFRTEDNWNIEITSDDYELINESWNFENPKDIIIYIDSDKHFNENSVYHSNISIQPLHDNNSLLLNYVLQPEKIFEYMYNQLINDYLRQRIIPSTPRIDTYYYVAKVLFEYLVPNLALSTFTGSTPTREFLLQVKNTDYEKTKNYDLRNLSSGEKNLFYLLLFINYIKNIGILIIDEPENHFHESLLVKFIEVLNGAIMSADYPKYINSKCGQNKPDPLNNNLEKLYNQYSLKSVILSTHSKNLIYHTFSTGTNYIINSGLKEINYSELEQTLRDIGISSIYEKVLFVEGKSDSDTVSAYLSDKNINIKIMNGCKQVIDIYNRILLLKDHLHSTKFLFLIDKDTRTNRELEKMREKDEVFFDQNFKVLEHHEFENYLLDEKLFSTLYNNHKQLGSDIDELNNEDIKEMIHKAAKETKNEVISKSLNRRLRYTLSNLNSHVKKREIDYSTSDNFERYLNDKIIPNITFNKIREALKEDYESCIDFYDDWDDQYLSYCDGKIAYKKLLNDFASILSTKSQKIEQELLHIIKHEKNTIANKLLKEISDHFKQVEQRTNRRKKRRKVVVKAIKT